MRKKKTSVGEALVGNRPIRLYYDHPALRGLVRPLLRAGFSNEVNETHVLPNTRGERITENQVVQILNGCRLHFLDVLAPCLAHNLQMMKESDHGRDEYPDGFENPVNNCHRQMPDLIRNIDSLIDLLKVAIEHGEENDNIRKKETLGACRIVREFGGVILQNTTPSPSSTSTAHWHDDAYFLAIELFETARELGKSVSFSKETSAGVVAIAALLDLGMVNHSGPEAIAHELKRRRKNESFLG